jgi:predicted DCC family thiol-disulfide oxidoreductase YuxK
VEAVPGEVRWVLFDGRCGLCDASVRWLLRRDRRGALRFAPLEGPLAAAVRARHPDLPSADETMVLVERPATAAELVRVRSRAALEILVALGGAWRLLALLRAVPAFLLDPLYRFVARRRVRWFGRLPACRMPTAAERGRFLELPGEAAEENGGGGGADAPSVTIPPA